MSRAPLLFPKRLTAKVMAYTPEMQEAMFRHGPCSPLLTTQQQWLVARTLGSIGSYTAAQRVQYTAKLTRVPYVCR